MATKDDTSAASASNSKRELSQRIEPQRSKLLQAHAIMICLREALLYADGDQTTIYAEAANAAALLTNDVAEGLDSVRLQ